MKKYFPLALTILITILIVASRLLPHAWNMTPVVAGLLFLSAYAGVRYSVTALFVSMLISDSIIGFYDWHIMIFVYMSFALSCLVGFWIGKKRNPQRVIIGAALSSALFFLVTNWAVWQFGTMYDHSWPGLFQSYLMGLPFFKHMFIGDIAYTALFFGTYEASKILVPRIRRIGVV